jgi:hypothetical protein
MSPKDKRADPTSLPVPVISGKWLIIGAMTVALVGAGGSWIFRYYATHRAAMFWGGHDASLIRDAPNVHLLTLARTEEPHRAGDKDFVQFGGDAYRIVRRIEVIDSHGLVHLRNALLEDHSYEWPVERAQLEAAPGWALEFTQEKEGAVVWLAEDCSKIYRPISNTEVDILSCQPIADGIRTVFKEWTEGNTETTSDMSAEQR